MAHYKKEWEIIFTIRYANHRTESNDNTSSDRDQSRRLRNQSLPGCEMGCLFCYAQFNKTGVKSNRPWGSYLKVKVNAVPVLEAELSRIRPERVLLGSTTECFQPIERKYRITEAILKMLNKKKIQYVIMTRSPAINDYLPVLKKGLCAAVYFTVDTLPHGMRQKFEPHGLDPAESMKAIEQLCRNKINTIA